MHIKLKYSVAHKDNADLVWSLFEGILEVFLFIAINT
jgi:hypothetical protein